MNMPGTPQERNRVKLHDILDVLDHQADALEDLGKKQHEMANSLRAAVLRRGSHSEVQLVAMRQGLRRQSERYEKAQHQLLVAMDLALHMEAD
jgi:hypothetical protein